MQAELNGPLRVLMEMWMLKTVIGFRECQGLLGIELETIYVMFWKAI